MLEQHRGLPVLEYVRIEQDPMLVYCSMLLEPHFITDAYKGGGSSNAAASALTSLPLP